MHYYLPFTCYRNVKYVAFMPVLRGKLLTFIANNFVLLYIVAVTLTL